MTMKILALAALAAIASASLPAPTPALACNAQCQATTANAIGGGGKSNNGGKSAKSGKNETTSKVPAHMQEKNRKKAKKKDGRNWVLSTPRRNWPLYFETQAQFDAERRVAREIEANDRRQSGESGNKFGGSQSGTPEGQSSYSRHRQ
mgnify:CR=1 FL=1